MTANELLALTPPKNGLDRWLIDGELVERWNGTDFHSPAHAATVVNVAALLSKWCRPIRARAFGYGCPFLLWRDPDSLLTFDVSVVTRDVSTRPHALAEYVETAPALAVEVVELDEDSDIIARLVETSLHHGVGTVWVVDPVEEIVVVHHRGMHPRYVNGGMILVGGDDLPGFACPVAEIFE